MNIPAFQPALLFYNGPGHRQVSRKAMEEAEKAYHARQACYVGITDMLTTLQKQARAKAAVPGAEQPVQEEVRHDARLAYGCCVVAVASGLVV